MNRERYDDCSGMYSSFPSCPSVPKVLRLRRSTAVNKTSLSLLERLKIAKPDDSAWNHLQSIYLPYIQRWIARVPGLGGESADLAQEVLLVVFREIPRFNREREGSFRAWLRQVTVNKVRTLRRKTKRGKAVGLGDLAEGFLSRLADPNDDLAQEWNADHDRFVAEKLLAIVKPDFDPKTWEAFQRFGFEGIPAREVALELGISENSVVLAKSRILKRLREEAGHLLE